MSENMFTTSEEVTNNFMKEFMKGFEDIEKNFLLDVYKINTLEEFQDINNKAFPSIPVENITEKALIEQDIPRPSKAMFILFFLLEWSVCKLLRTFLEELLSQVPSMTAAKIHSHKKKQMNQSNNDTVDKEQIISENKELVKKYEVIISELEAKIKNLESVKKNETKNSKSNKWRNTNIAK
ncbi:hypothetical protein RIR_jg14601.t1 [Rhizophagus irregularis DAOM 181602=DAOM 197198]|nr:hypothetical protein RIR_jg14601.t1 [Rhizophagus irregularis DAOM 181602=DAOM 197198]